MRDQLVQTFLEYNQQLNLSAIRDEEGIKIKHIADAMELTKILDLGAYRTLADVGTGGGFPLLALSMYNQANQLGLSLTGIDARRKKIDAINAMIQKLGLPDTIAVRTRVEEHHQTYDVVTARAVAYADVIIPRCVPLCKKWGRICLYKEYKEEEKQTILKQAKHYNLTLVNEHHYSLYDGDITRVLYILAKNSMNA